MSKAFPNNLSPDQKQIMEAFQAVRSAFAELTKVHSHENLKSIKINLNNCERALQKDIATEPLAVKTSLDQIERYIRGLPKEVKKTKLQMAVINLREVLKSPNIISSRSPTKRPTEITDASSNYL